MLTYASVYLLLLSSSVYICASDYAWVSNGSQLVLQSEEPRVSIDIFHLSVLCKRGPDLNSD